MTRLLILSCSRRKLATPGPLPAMERYDGPAFRVLRRHHRRHQDRPQTLILSAEHGLLAATAPLANYDRVLDPARAAELRPVAEEALRQVRAHVGGFDEVLVVAGRHYCRALGDVAQLLGAPVTYATGKPDQRLRQLRAWLYSPISPTASTPCA